MEHKQVGFMFPVSLHRALHHHAVDTGRKMSQIAEDAVREYLERHDVDVLRQTTRQSETSMERASA